MLQPYSRPPVSVLSQIDHLRSKGLLIHDQREGVKHLTGKGYYRLKAYMLPYRNVDHDFDDGTTLEAIISLHDLDEKLRHLVFKHIQRIEIFVRNSFNEYLCEKTSNAFWYLDSSLFGRNAKSYADTVNKLRSSFLESQETFATHFRNQYYNEFCSFYSLMPPSWMAIELMTFGNMLTLLNNVSDDTIDRYKLDRWVRKEIGPDKFRKLTNWLLCIRDVRNQCAHHNRLFNRNFPAPDGIKKYLGPIVNLAKNEKNQDQLNRLYTALATIQVISRAAGLPDIGRELESLFAKHPEIENHLSSMGFPENWKNDTLFFPE